MPHLLWHLTHFFRSAENNDRRQTPQTRVREWLGWAELVGEDAVSVAQGIAVMVVVEDAVLVTEGVALRVVEEDGV